jgi:hypothetical protein
MGDVSMDHRGYDEHLPRQGVTRRQAIQGLRDLVSE